MSRIDNSSQTQQAKQTQNQNQAPKAEPKRNFGAVLQKKQSGKATQQGQTQANAGAGQGLERAGRNAGRGGQGGQGEMGTLAANQQAGQGGRPARLMDQAQNPQLAKLQEASKQFAAQLGKAKEASAQGQQKLGEAQAETKAADMGRNEARSVDTQRNETRGEMGQKHQLQQHGEARVKADAQQMAQRQLGQARNKMRSELMSGVGAVSEAGKNGAAVQVKGARKVKELPEEFQDMINKMVDGVRVGVNEVGHAEFQIDLKEGVMQGMTLRVSADGGKVSCQFIGGDGAAKNFIESNEGGLARALESKGMQLEKLSVKTA